MWDGFPQFRPLPWFWSFQETMRNSRTAHLTESVVSVISSEGWDAEHPVDKAGYCPAGHPGSAWTGKNQQHYSFNIHHSFRLKCDRPAHNFKLPNVNKGRSGGRKLITLLSIGFPSMSLQAEEAVTSLPDSLATRFIHWFPWLRSDPSIKSDQTDPVH